MLETVIAMLSFTGALFLSILVRLKKIPPISLTYVMAKPAEKDKLKNNTEEIRFISTIFLMIAISFILIFFLTLFPTTRALQVTTYAYMAFLLIYVFYKSIKSESASANKGNE